VLIVVITSDVVGIGEVVVGVFPWPCLLEGRALIVLVEVEIIRLVE
jgi:hypothetical protein